MLIPVQITFRGLARIAWLADEIRERSAGLDRYGASITSCRVVVEPSHGRHHDANRYRLRIDMTVPGDELVVSRELALHGGRKVVASGPKSAVTDLRPERRPAQVAVRQAFDAARRQLQAHKGRVVRRRAPARRVPRTARPLARRAAQRP